MSLLIEEDDIPFEQQLVKDPYDIDVWLQYYNHKLAKPNHTVEELIYILSRSLNYLSRSYKIWMILLQLKIENIDDVGSVVKSFETASEFLNKFPKYWSLYLSYLKNKSEYFEFTKLKFQECLRSLPLPLHFRIWPMYLEFADTTRDFEILKRFFKFKVAFHELEKSDFEQLLNKLVEYSSGENLEDLIEIFTIFLSTSEILATVDSEYDIYWKYITVLMMYKSDLVDKVVQECIQKFPDQRAKVIVEWASFYSGDIDKLHEIFQTGITDSDTIRDFTTIYEAYLEYEESVITGMIEEPGPELDALMNNFEKLMSQREFMINDIYLKQDPNNVETWLKRIELFDKETQLKEILETYVKAIMTINPKKVSKNLHLIWIGYIKVYESNGDLNTARMILTKCINVPFVNINDLVEVWLEWSNMELRNDDIDQLIKILETPLTVQDPYINYNDENLPVQSRIFKSFKIWSFYLDLIESSGDIDKTSSVYEKMIDLKIAKPITLINYASFYEENQMFEKSLSVFEKGLKIFNYPIVYEIWNIYLSKILKFLKLININKERIRDLFDQCIENCPLTNIHSVILLYADFEESQKSISKMFQIYKKNVVKLDPESKIIVYKAYLSKANTYLDLLSLRPIYEDIINDDQLPLTVDLLNFVKDFVNLENKLSDLHRARFILRNFYEFLNQSKKAPLLQDLDNFWKNFELNNGDEETFKEMLRFKRICEVKFGKLENKVLEGFVKSSEGPKVSSINASKPQFEVNPDAIELEMDSSDDDEDAS